MASRPKSTLGVAAGPEDGCLEGSGEGSEHLLLGANAPAQDSFQVLDKNTLFKSYEPEIEIKININGIHIVTSSCLLLSNSIQLFIHFKNKTKLQF